MQRLRDFNQKLVQAVDSSNPEEVRLSTGQTAVPESKDIHENIESGPNDGQTQLLEDWKQSIQKRKETIARRKEQINKDKISLMKDDAVLQNVQLTLRELEIELRDRELQLQKPNILANQNTAVSVTDSKLKDIRIAKEECCNKKIRQI